MTLTVSSLALNIEDELKNVFGTPVNAQSLEDFADAIAKAIIDELKDKKETITLYTSGGFTDLCRGGHLENPNRDIDTRAFKLARIAGAYWRGDEKNKMLTRIYGLAFDTKKELLE